MACFAPKKAWRDFEEAIFVTWPGICEAFDTYVGHVTNAQEQDENYGGAKQVYLRKCATEKIAVHEKFVNGNKSYDQLRVQLFEYHEKFSIHHHRVRLAIDRMYLELELLPPGKRGCVPPWSRRRMANVFSQQQDWMQALYHGLTLLETTRAVMWKLVDPNWTGTRDSAAEKEKLTNLSASFLSSPSRRGERPGSPFSEALAALDNNEKTLLTSDMPGITHPALNVFEVVSEQRIIGDNYTKTKGGESVQSATKMRFFQTTASARAGELVFPVPMLRCTLGEAVLLIADVFRKMLCTYLQLPPTAAGRLQLPVLAPEILKQNRSRGVFAQEEVVTQLCLTALALALVRLSVSQLATLKQRNPDKIQLYYSSASSAVSTTVQDLLTKKQGLVKSVLVLGPEWGAVEEGGKWLRQSNSMENRCRRLLEVMRTLQTLWGGGYRVPGTGELQSLQFPNFCAEKTQVLQLDANLVKFMETKGKLSAETTAKVAALFGIRIEDAATAIGPGSAATATTLRDVDVASKSSENRPAVAPSSTNADIHIGAATGSAATAAGAPNAAPVSSTVPAKVKNKGGSSGMCCCAQDGDAQGAEAEAAAVPDVKGLARFSIASIDDIRAGEGEEGDPLAALAQGQDDPRSTNKNNTNGATSGLQLNDSPVVSPQAQEGAADGQTTFEILSGAPVKGTTAMGVARSRAESGDKRVVALNAAAAFKVGGGALTGGRHALEESWCATTTLLRSLLQAQFMVERGSIGPRSISSGLLKDNRASVASAATTRSPRMSANVRVTTTSTAATTPAQSSTHHGAEKRYFPSYSCVMSPKVEIFRGSIFDNYRFLPKPVALAGVVSIAAFNCNPSVRDAPIDAPQDPSAYRDGLRRKWFVALCGAALLEGQVLVVPDVGCGVFRNPPEEVGDAFAFVYSQFFANTFERVVLLGNPAFCERAAAGAAVVVRAQ
ncbi:unnamed protein product [Amoebophrya sp. A120]|nr:unnamed protein product [Amoebophrya sp. A120]|eukprot:GSA120T00015091001.1